MMASQQAAPASPRPASLDERIADARQSCAADESRCQKICAGIGAIGIIGILRGFGGDTASNQMQACSTRCDASKATCDEQVAALEQQRIDAARSPGAQLASASPGAGFSGDCKQAYDAQEAEFAALNRRAPNTKAVMPGLQTVLYMTSKRLELLDAVCKGQPQYGEYASMKRSNAQAVKTCQGLANDGSLCKSNPSRPGWL
jgi:hypothetical protein